MTIRIFPIATADKKNEIVISSAAAQKFGVKAGDKLVLSDEVNERLCIHCEKIL